MSAAGSDLLGALARHAVAQEKVEVAAMEAASPSHPRAEELFAAVKNDDVDAVTQLLAAGVPVMSRSADAHRWTPLHLARSPAAVRALLAAGALVDARNHLNGLTPLHAASMRGAFDEMLALLQAVPPPDVHILDANGQSPLFFAATGPFGCALTDAQERAVDALLNAGADANGATPEGLTPLMQASRKGHLPLVHRLLAAAACTILVNSDGQTALELAKGEHVVQALTAHRETHAAAEAAFMAQRASAPATDSSTASAIDPRLVDAALPAQRSALAVQQAPGATHLWGVGDIVDVKVAGEWSRHAGKVQAVALVGSGQGQARYTILVRHNAHEDDALCMLLKGKEEAEMRTSSRAFLELQPTACCQIA